MRRARSTKLRGGFSALAGTLILALAFGCSGTDADPPGPDPDSTVVQADASVDVVGPDSQPAEPPDDPAAPFAVVELFTSEGCSSCPAAEKVLHQLVDEQRKTKLRVFPLAWHVHYWDYLGWPDGYAAEAHTQRQKDYAAAMSSTKVFTPQMLLSGATNLPATNVSLVGTAIQGALQQATNVSVTVWAGSATSSGGVTTELRVNHKVKGAPVDADLLVALVERGLSTAVKAGENAGKTLKHENTVRAYAEAKAGAGQVTLKLPPGVTLDNCSLIGLVQDATTMKVLGATGVDIKPGT